MKMKTQMLKHSELLMCFSLHVAGVKVERMTASRLCVSWDEVPVVKRGDTMEYVLQAQRMGTDQDFVQVSGIHPSIHPPTHPLFDGVFTIIVMCI